MTGTITRLSREMMYVSDNVFYILFSILILLICVIVVYWFYTRKRMQELQHQIPANVLKSYLDSVIQNSNALKSSLFRGGGLDSGEGIPSVVPGGSLPTGNVDGAELASKNAEIAALKGQVANKESLIRDLEVQLSAAGGDDSESAAIITKLNAEIAELKAQIEALKAASAAQSDTSSEVDALKSERDELQSRLKEYEMIEGDLADLRKFKQENELLKAQLAQVGGDPAPAQPEPEVDPTPAPGPEIDVTPEPAEVPVPEEEPTVAPTPEEVPAPTPEPTPEEPIAEAAPEPVMEEAPEPIEEAAAPAASEEAKGSDTGEQKSAEELLSEFEKMLG